MMQEDRSQHRNRAKAMAVLRARLYDHERQKLDAARAAERRGQVGSGDRSERIRTYNFPQGRVSDHRINLTLYKLPQIIEGEALGEIIDALVTEHQAALLAAEGVRDGRRDRGATPRSDRLPARAAGRLARSSSATPASTRPSSTRASWSAMRSGSTMPRWRRRRSAASPTGEADAIAALARRRLAREPVARIVGVKEFWGLPLALNADTLVPRPETETVVEAALAALGDRRRAARAAHRRSRHRLGRAAAGAALANCRRRAASAPTSASPRSLAPAQRRRARAWRRAPRSSPATTARRSRGGFDLVVANPPYVAQRRHRGACSPRCATSIRAARSTAAPTALLAYRAIAADARRLLAPRRRAGAGARRRPARRGQRDLSRGRARAPGAARSDLSGVPRALPSGLA